MVTIEYFDSAAAPGQHILHPSDGWTHHIYCDRGRGPEYLRYRLTHRVARTHELDLTCADCDRPMIDVMTDVGDASIFDFAALDVYTIREEPDLLDLLGDPR